MIHINSDSLLLRSLNTTSNLSLGSLMVWKTAREKLYPEVDPLIQRMIEIHGLRTLYNDAWAVINQLLSYFLRAEKIQVRCNTRQLLKWWGNPPNFFACPPKFWLGGVAHGRSVAAYTFNPFTPGFLRLYCLWHLGSLKTASSRGHVVWKLCLS